MAEPLKDRISAVTVDELADRFTAIWPHFDAAEFRAGLAGELEGRELKDRVNVVADALAEHLPADYPAALSLVVGVAERPLNEWAGWVLCSFVERHGLDHPTESLAAMPILTKRWSCEFAIRPFLERHLTQTRTQLRCWATDDDERVRRLASEGTRPLLPWGRRVAALTDDPSIGLDLLAELRHDRSETVRRSVANHLNDVAKSRPELVIALLTDWVGEEEPVDPAMVRHALRTLVKRGDHDALRLLGFTTHPRVEVVEFSCRPTRVRPGERIELTALLSSTADCDQHLVVDFVIHHVTASGDSSPKVFKWTTLRLAPDETAELRKRRLIQHGSTRTYRSGRHRVDLQVAGQVVASSGFDVAAH